jgi:hypothetical protein
VFDVGTRVMAQASFDQQYRARPCGHAARFRATKTRQRVHLKRRRATPSDTADVVDRRGVGAAVKYYVHYVDCASLQRTRPNTHSLAPWRRTP